MGMSMGSRAGIALAGAALAAALTLSLFAAGPASAECRNVWAPSPDGGQLLLICDGNTGDAGGGSGGTHGHEKHKRKVPQFGAIALDPVPVGGTFSGATSAGYSSKGKARKHALRGCARSAAGQCAVMATAKNGWAVLVAAGGPGGVVQFFSGTGKTQFAAQAEAEERAEQALGSGRTGPTDLVVGVDARRKQH